MKMTRQEKTLLCFVALVFAAMCALAVCTRADDDHKRSHDERRRDDNRNYIVERQLNYQVEGVPTDRLIIGKRQIDVYSDGTMFEGDHVVGHRK